MQDFDLILADRLPPAFDGFEALNIFKHLTASGRVTAALFIFVSGALGEEMAIDALKSGAADYVLKRQAGQARPSGSEGDCGRAGAIRKKLVERGA
jgi:PleD family two-component response regulator